MPSAAEIAAAVRSGALNPVDAVEQALARIDAVEPEIHAWVQIDREGALRQARELSQRDLTTLPLAGVPVGIKDIVDVAGLPTRLGAPPFAHYTPNRDATAVARLRQAGAVILGKTHTTEFAYLDPAPTRNPWQRDHTPGGSSSGSAASVGARTIPFAIGSQTVGSVLRPAAYCGIVGLKPTYGLISYAGTAALAMSFDHLGVLADNVADAALALSVLAGPDTADPASIDAPPADYDAAASSRSAPRLGLIRPYYHGHAGAEVEAHLDAVVAKLRAAGATVDDAEMPGDATAIRQAGDAIMKYEAAQAHEALYHHHKDEYRPSIKALVEDGRATSRDDYLAPRDTMAAIRSAIIETLAPFDALLMPTAPSTAPAGLESTGSGIFCAPASFTGLPAISLPSGLGAGGLPLSIQLMSAPLAETALLSAAAWLESTLNFTARPDIAP
jgi:aspartyl-tRNA(Asn)/glutamyl-tRNA(Gln) amidotransferase subunit A